MKQPNLSDNIVHHTRVAGGTSFYYGQAGSGTPVLLLHGCPQTSHAWRHLIAPLASTYTLIIPDLPGLGYSKRLPSHDKHGVATALHELVHALGFGDTPLKVVGHDIGGMVGYAYAAGFPAEVERLAVLESGASFPAAMLDFNKGLGLWHVPFHMAPEIPELLVTGREEAYLEQFFRLAYDPAFLSEPDKQQYVRAYAAPGALRSYFDYYRALPEDNVRIAEASKSNRLTLPVLAVGGEVSLGVYAEYSLREVADNVRGAVIPECGHWMPEERPEALAELLTPFLRGE